MKKIILSMMVMATSCINASANECCESHRASCCESCCEPCCTPEPKKCIDCECYTPQYYDLQCDCGVFVDVEFLYWYARETNTAYAVELLTQSEENTVIPANLRAYFHSYKRLKAEWDPGLRVGLGYNSSCDGWDMYLNWTYFKNTATRSSKAEKEFFGPASIGDTVLLNPWLTGSFERPFGDEVSAKWQVFFNQVDWELGKQYWLSKCFNLRPYAGLRGAWTRTKFNVNEVRNLGPFNPNDNVLLAEVTHDRFKNTHWGVGCLAGIQPNFSICSNFIFYANLDVALIWGEQKMRKKQNYFDEEGIQADALVVSLDTSNTVKDQWYLMSPIFDLGLGFRWEETWCCDRFRTRLDLGWEHHVWIDHSIRQKSSNRFQSAVAEDDAGLVTYATRFTEEAANLGYGGFVLRGRLDF